MWWFWKERFELFSGWSVLVFALTVSVEFVLKQVGCIQDVSAFTLFFLNSVFLSAIKRITLPQDLNDLITSSGGISCHAFLTHCNTGLLLGTCFLPYGLYVNGPFTIQAWYCGLTLVLKGLIMRLLRGWWTGVRSPGIAAMSAFLRTSSSFRLSVRCSRKESHTSKALWSLIKCWVFWDPFFHSYKRKIKNYR